MDQTDARREMAADTSQWNDWEHPKTGWNLDGLELELPDKFYDEGTQNGQSEELSQEDTDTPQKSNEDATDGGAPSTPHYQDEDTFDMGAPKVDEVTVVGGLSSLAEPSEPQRKKYAESEVSRGQEDENRQGTGDDAGSGKGKEDEEGSKSTGDRLSTAAMDMETDSDPGNGEKDDATDAQPEHAQNNTKATHPDGRAPGNKEQKRPSEVSGKETVADAAAPQNADRAVKMADDDAVTVRNKDNGTSHTENTTGENAVNNDNEELDDEVVVDSEEEEVVEKPQKKAGKSRDGKAQKSGIRQFVPLILIVGFVLLSGGAYLLYNMVAGPMQPTPLRRPSAAAPVRSGLERPTAPKPQIKRPSSEESAIALADELAAREGTKNEKSDRPTQPRPATEQAQPAPTGTAGMTGTAPGVREQTRPRANTASTEDIDAQILAKLKELGVTLDRIEKAVNQKRTALEAQGSVNDDVRESLSSMTQDIQKATKENARLKKDLEETRKALEQSYAQIAALKEQANLTPKQRQQAEAAKQKADAKKDDKNSAQSQQAAKQGDSSTIKDWQVLGFSGSRVVINNGKSVHSVSVGGTLGGVKILNIDIDSGDIKTSAGTLKYNH